MYKTKKNNKKPKTFKKRKINGGVSKGFVNNLRQKTRRMPRNERDPRTTTDSTGRNRFNRNRRYYVSDITSSLHERTLSSPPTISREKVQSPVWQDNGIITDNQFGPSKEGFYAGPSIKYGSRDPIPHGKEGTILYPSGHIYTGDFVRGLREGQGKLKIKEGPTYEGVWKNDKFTDFTEWKEENKKKNKKTSKK